MTKTCIICGNGFEVYGSQITCSAECGKQHSRKYNRDYSRKQRENPNFLIVSRKRTRDSMSRWRSIPENLAIQRERNRKWRSFPENKKKAKILKAKWLQKNKDRQLFLQRRSARKWNNVNGGISPATQNFFLTMKLGLEMQKQQTETKMKTLTKIPTIQQFAEALQKSLDGMKEACVMLVQMVEADSDVYEKIIAQIPAMSYNKLESMRRVGKGEIEFELLFDPSLAARKLLSLPPTLQRKLYHEPVKIVKLVGEKKVVEEKPIQKMSRAELAQVIDEDAKRVRTVEEQINYVKPPTPIRRAERYEIVGDRLKVLANTEFSVGQLEELIQRMKQKAIQSLEKSMKQGQVR